MMVSRRAADNSSIDLRMPESQRRRKHCSGAILCFAADVGSPPNLGHPGRLPTAVVYVFKTSYCPFPAYWAVAERNRDNPF